MRLLAAALLLTACSARPLDVHCSLGTDCAEQEWCVENWQLGVNPIVKESAGMICATSCATDADCATGTCMGVSEGATAALANLTYRACRE